MAGDGDLSFAHWLPTGHTSMLYVRVQGFQ